MKRICCLVERWESGGIESFLYNILTRIDLTQLQVDIVVSSLGKSVFTEPLQKLGVSFFELSGSQRKVRENCRRFRLLLENRRYDVLHLNAFQGLSLSYLQIARRAGVPVRIAHSHNTDLRKSLTRPLKLAVHAWAKERYTREATALWACSRDAASFLFSKSELSQKGFQYIPNGIDTERFRFDPAIRETVRTKLKLSGMFVIGNVGRLCCQKNQDFLLDVFEELLKRNLDSRLLLVGEGEDKTGLMRKAHRLGIAEKVLFYGTTDHVERLLWAMDVFTFPSRFEGLGIAAVEAQAAGLPVLCSKEIPPEAIVTDQAIQLELSAGPSVWAERVLELRAVDRETGAETIAAAGFDTEAVSERIREKWMGDRDGSRKNLGYCSGLQGGTLSSKMPGQHCGSDLSKFRDHPNRRRLTGRLRGHL